MSGAQTPSEASIQIKGSPPPVKRFNKRAIGSVVGVSALAILLSAGFALRSPEDTSQSPQELFNTTSKALPDALSELPKSYSEVRSEPRTRVLGPPLPGDIGAGLYAKPKDIPTDNPFRYQPPPAYSQSYGQGRARPAASLPSSRTSKLFFIEETGNARVAKDDQSNTVPFTDPGIAALTAAFSQRPSVNPSALEILESAVGSLGGNQRTKHQFGQQTDIYNPHSLHMPVSSYQIMAGTIISASLITELNSDLPGQVIAQVTENVYDSATGEHLLIPQGSRLLGEYDSDIESGQSRALVIWNRLIRPDGSSLVIENSPGVDLSGQSGLTDRVDRHTGSLVRAALLSTVLSAAAELGTDSDDRLTLVLRDGGQRTINQAGQKIVTRSLSRKPTIRVRQGWRLGVIVNRDLVLTPYEN